ncbi:hypothetical protein FO519_010231 [Halicephalobus sp. NKZ332]|nr:hypothetical protein FO519_010231 [Halicephalobus sp. NKZ332]
MTQGEIWPLPWTVNYYNNETFSIDPDTFVWNSWHSGCEIIDKALQRYKKLAFPGHTPGKGKTSGHFATIASVTVSSQAGCSTDYPQFGMDESYKIQAVPGSSQVLILGNTVWGALRGLESFSQLIYKDKSGSVSPILY